MQAYLEKRNYVHRDIAARNMLLAQVTGGNRQPILKVADYGLCKKLDDDEYFSRFTLTLPFRAAAPEVLQKRQFSLKSDV